MERCRMITYLVEPENGSCDGLQGLACAEEEEIFPPGVHATVPQWSLPFGVIYMLRDRMDRAARLRRLRERR